MSARVFLHPRCTTPVGAGAFEAMMQERGFDFASICLFDWSMQENRKRTELVRRAGYDAEKRVSTFERMDGVRFQHADSPPPAVA